MSARTQVKVCGVTRVEDALMAADCGVDAIGFNFWPSSARYVEMSVAAEIARALPESITRVGLFVDADADVIRATLAEVQLDVLQFHGVETSEMCASFAMPFVKAIRATSAAEIESNAAEYSDAIALLLDTPSDGQFGGSGSVFDWQVVPELVLPLILAGGLEPGNVAAAIRQLAPCMVDVASGVESSKGIKDEVLMREFMASVQEADRSKQ